MGGRGKKHAFMDIQFHAISYLKLFTGVKIQIFNWKRDLFCLDSIFKLFMNEAIFKKNNLIDFHSVLYFSQSNTTDVLLNIMSFQKNEK